MSRRLTGERVVTREGAFNPTWQRHVAAYAFAAEVLPAGRVLDLGCGTGHSYHLLHPRTTVGVDVDAAVLEGQDRETAAADMRALPFPDGSFDAVLSVQSIEHVPDPERALAEVRRVLAEAGTALFVTPNRLTFARPDEIVDPYHHVEYDAAELHALCEQFFGSVQVRGLFGSPRYEELRRAELDRLERLLRMDPLRMRQLIPRRIKQRLYDRRLAAERLRAPDPLAAQIDPGDFEVRDAPLERSLDLIAICREPRREPYLA